MSVSGFYRLLNCMRTVQVLRKTGTGIDVLGHARAGLKNLRIFLTGSNLVDFYGTILARLLATVVATKYLSKK